MQIWRSWGAFRGWTQGRLDPGFHLFLGWLVLGLLLAARWITRVLSVGKVDEAADQQSEAACAETHGGW